jgi:putative phosphoesterase
VRIAIVSDTHLPRGSRTLPEACVERLVSADAILHCGDFMAVEVLDWLEGLGPPVHGVLGNVDDPTLQDRLPERHVAEVGGARIGMVHIPGPKAGRVERLRRLFPDTAAVVFGHTHLPEHADTGDGFQVFNPGSPTERRRAPARTMGMATVGDGGRVAFELVAVG